jgi:hypothetical protein
MKPRKICNYIFNWMSVGYLSEWDKPSRCSHWTRSTLGMKSAKHRNWQQKLKSTVTVHLADRNSYRGLRQGTMSLSELVVVDDLTILLGLISATLFLIRNLYRPQPLLHPILLGRQSDVSRVRYPGESAIYRNYGTGLVGRVSDVDYILRSIFIIYFSFL